MLVIASDTGGCKNRTVEDWLHVSRHLFYWIRLAKMRGEDKARIFTRYVPTYLIDPNSHHQNKVSQGTKNLKPRP